MNSSFDMVAKTFQGLEGVLAEELRGIGAENVQEGKRMVSFTGDLAILYKANMCCRTALRILKPFYTFEASDPDELYARVKDFDWSTLMNDSQTFAIDTVAFSEEFRHSQFVTYRVKDGIVDWFRDRYGDDHRPRVRLDGADILLNVHISGTRVTLSLDSSGESLHKRGWRKAQTEAPINEVLAAGIILMTGWRGETPFVDPMCGSGTFAIEAAMIAAGINPGIYRKHFAFENWPDFDAELLDEIYNDDSNEREVTVPIVAADISPRAIAIATENAKSAAVARYITFETRPISQWTEAPKPAGVLVTNPPYGKRIGSDDMNALYDTIGRVLKHVFTGYHAWIIGYEDVYFHEIGLAPSTKVAINNGGLDCELREYVIFEGKKADFRAAGGRISNENREESRPRKADRAPRKGAFNGDKPARREGRPEGRSEGRSFRKEGRFEGRPEGRPFRKDRDAAPVRFEKKPARKFDEAEEPKKERRPLKLDRLGRQPSIPAEKTVIISRPSWRVRKKDQNNDNNTDNNTNSDK
ncbi:MAG: RNA methyltransferase [Bacteroidales bacterium]|nr:RNA methyltransferase [Bacteroidales bacterium]